MLDELQEDQNKTNFTVEEVVSTEHNNMLQTKTAYSTAVQVIKPRNLNLIIRKVEEEAAIAGDEFYYAWKQGGDFIEGVTIGGALALARNWGNSAVDVKVEEQKDSYIFHGAFIDLETGFNLVRPFRQNKQSPKKKDGKEIYSGDRGKDIIFQIGASKAMRNVVLNAVPKWLTTKLLKKAKENITLKIEQMGIEKAKSLVVKKLAALGIDITTIEANYGMQKGWDIPKLVILMGTIRSLEEGYEKAETVFPTLADESKNTTPTPNLITKPSEQQTKTEPKNPVEKKLESLQEQPQEEIPEERLDNPKYWVYLIKQCKTKSELKSFLKKHSADLSMFGDSDMLKIQIAVDEREKELQ